MTSEYTFAAAPWESQEEHGKYAVRSPQHGLIADVFPWSTAGANARLIAAAPELLAALQRLLGATNTIEVLGEWVAADRNHRLEKEERAKVNVTLAQARAAIAKALGQPQ